MPEIIHVAAAAIENELGQILLTRRAEDTHQGGLWEFPGGKLDEGESVEQALIRELDEELGIHPTAYRPLIKVQHDYGDRHVILDMWLVSAYKGAASGVEGQPLCWVEREDLASYPMPAADTPVIQALTLPDRYLVTPEPVYPLQQYFDLLEKALKKGIRLLQFRAKTLPADEYAAMAEKIIALCHGHDCRVLLNADERLVAETGADGIHLTSERLLGLSSRPLEQDLLVGASCHNAAELSQAARIGASFALLSPVQHTASHPELVPIGWDAFASAVADVNLPVYALGGVSAAQLEYSWQHGGQGVAGISGFIQSESEV
jgi:8-oxo-dGTP diphosphatase